MRPVRTAARALLGGVFVTSGAQALAQPDRLVPRAAPLTYRAAPVLKRVHERIPTDARTLVRLNGAVQAAAGLLLVTRWHRPAAAVLAATVVPTTVAGHPFWKDGDPARARADRIHFAKNMGLLGGLLLAAVDTQGRPGVAWRLRHLVEGRPGLAWRLRHLADTPPPATWRLRQVTVGRPGLTTRAAQFAVGRPGLSPRARELATRTRQIAAGRPGVAWRTERLVHDLDRSARRGAARVRRQTRSVARSTGLAKRTGPLDRLSR